MSLFQRSSTHLGNKLITRHLFALSCEERKLLCRFGNLALLLSTDTCTLLPSASAAVVCAWYPAFFLLASAACMLSLSG